MSREFNGSSDQWNSATSVGQANIAFGSYFAIARVDDDGVARVALNVRDTVGAANRILLTREATNLLGCRYGSARTSTTITMLTSDGWCLFGFTKGTGTVTPNAHIYKYAADAWTHEAASGTSANASTTADAVRLGHRNSDQRWDGHIAAVGIWNYEMSTTQVESLAHSFNHWHALAPVAMWVFDQADTAMLVNDLTGNGANESSKSGTTVGTSSSPISYGQRVLGVTREAGGAAPTTSLVWPTGRLQAILGM